MALVQGLSSTDNNKRNLFQKCVFCMNWMKVLFFFNLWTDKIKFCANCATNCRNFIFGQRKKHIGCMKHSVKLCEI